MLFLSPLSLSFHFTFSLQFLSTLFCSLLFKTETHAISALPSSLSQISLLWIPMGLLWIPMGLLWICGFLCWSGHGGGPEVVDGGFGSAWIGGLGLDRHEGWVWIDVRVGFVGDFFWMGLLVMAPMGLNRSSDGSDSDFFLNGLIVGFDGFFFYFFYFFYFYNVVLVLMVVALL